MVQNRNHKKEEPIVFKKKYIKEKKKVRTMPKLVFSVFILFIIFLFIYGIGIYKYNWQGTFVNILLRVVPYPSAIVDGKIVPYVEFKKELVILNHFYQKQKELKESADVPTEEEIKNFALNKQIRNKIIEELAKENDIDVSSKDIDEAYKELVIDAGGEEKVENILSEFYGLDIKELKKNVLKISLMSKYLKDIINEHEDNLSLQEKAKNVLKLAKNDPSNFEEIIKSYSTDKGDETGDLGYVKRGELRSELEAVLFSLEKGAVSDLVETEEGWHILKAEDKIIAGDKVYQVKIRQILIKKKTLEDFIEEKMEDSWIWRWI